MFPNSEKFEQHCSKIFSERKVMYQDAWKEVGVVGAVIEIHAKWSRLKNLVLQRPQGQPFTVEEIVSIRDTLLDLHNYAVIANECLTSGFWLVDDTEAAEDRAAMVASLLEQEA